MPRSPLAPKDKGNRRPRKAESAKDAHAGKPAARLLVDWYRARHRRLPWRAPVGQTNDPYHVWLSEIMLQQTTVPTVISYYEKFLRLWPTLGDLATAPLDDVLKHWAGLGYYARARNLHKCAGVVAREHSGVFPDTVDGLLALPGIGPYTSSAIGAMAFGLPVVPVDGNVERVITRLRMIGGPVRRAKNTIKAAAQKLYDDAPDVFSGDLAQGLMDLGATICTPRAPQCHRCPLAAICTAHGAGRETDYPVPEPKMPKPVRQGHVFLVSDGQGRYLLERRAERGLLGGMVGFPTTEWAENGPDHTKPPIPVKNAREVGQVRHTFTHFHLVLTVVRGDAAVRDVRAPLLWYDGLRLDDAGLPKVFLKALAFIVE
jgi:A/G-specific adenine glycosylase